MTLLDPSPAARESVRQVAVPGRRLAVRRIDGAAPAGGEAGGGSAATGGAARPPVLLLHGVPQTSRSFRRLMPELGRDRTVLAPDLPGLGASEVRGPYDIDAVVGSLLALLAAELDPGEPDLVTASPGAGPDPLDAKESDGAGGDQPDEALPQRIDVVGHDWGGSLALALAAARPGLVRRLVVISAPYRRVDLLRAWHLPLLGLVPPAAFSAAGRAIVTGMFRYAWGSGRAPEELVADYAGAYAAPDRVRAMAGYYRAAVRRRRRPSALPAARPDRSLVVWGTDDAAMPLAVGESVLADLSSVADPASVRMVTLPGVGHWPLEEAPELVDGLIAEFLRAD